MAFFDTLKQNLMTASQVTMDKSKNTAEILKLKDQMKRLMRIECLEQAIEWKEDALKNLKQED